LFCKITKIKQKRKNEKGKDKIEKGQGKQIGPEQEPTHSPADSKPEPVRPPLSLPR
jgi:hypothetical protein